MRVWSFVLALTLCRAALSEIPLNGSFDDDVLSLVYSSIDGNLSIERGFVITSVEVRSDSGSFDPDSPGYTPPGLCNENHAQVCGSHSKFFLLDPGGFSSAIDFGTFVQSGLLADAIAADLTMSALVVLNQNGSPSVDHPADLVYLPAIHGDFDGDGMLGLNDIESLSAAVRAENHVGRFDVNGDFRVDLLDRDAWVHDLARTWYGDSNLDGEFNSSDLVDVHAANPSRLYEIDLPAAWRDGDWNGDGRYNSSDFVFAFTAGGYERGPRHGPAAVPEPSMPVVLMLFVMWRRVRTRWLYYHAIRH